MRRVCWGLLLGLLLPTAAMADEFQQGLQTLWEALWHQSGTPTRLVRWQNDIRVRVEGVNLAAHHDHVMEALRAVTQEAGLKLTDVTGQPDAEQTANVTVEIVPNNQLEDNQPCVTYVDFRTETKIDSATVQMRDRDEWRCAYHESMHVMGVRGHPAAGTVLSYFPTRVDQLMPLDRVMLRAWYSNKMAAGMTPFEALPVLADELIATQQDKQLATQERDQFFADVVQSMRQYADGTGHVPGIVKRSGKATPDGIKFGRSEMSYFLGVAYLDGVTVPRDPAQGRKWLERAATMGNRSAQTELGSFK